MDLDIAHVLPQPGPVWGPYPQRDSRDLAPPLRRPRWPGLAARLRRTAAAAAAHAPSWRALPPTERPAALAALRTALRRDGLTPEAVAPALGCVGALAATTLGRTPYPTQFFAAAALLDSRMAEMATGEGKTLAIGLAACVAALAGVPAHAVTANDYLAARDAARRRSA